MLHGVIFSGIILTRTGLHIPKLLKVVVDDGDDDDDDDDDDDW